MSHGFALLSVACRREARRLTSFAPLLGALGALGCQADFPPQSQIHGLRVLAVRPEPGSGTPGGEVRLNLLLADGRQRDRNDDGTLAPAAPVSVAWFGGCHNPPSRQYFACLPALRALASNPDALALGLAQFGTYQAGVTSDASLHYAFTLPDDILSAAPREKSDPVHFGVSYVFWAVCAGTLSPSDHGEFPLACSDAAGHAVGPSGFVIGFTTFYSYEGDDNQNTDPVLAGLKFRSAPVAAAGVDAFASAGLTPCMADADCADGAACSDNGVCAPVVPACAGKGCPSYRVTPEVDAQSFETVSGGFEIQWASYYATLGAFTNPTRLVVDRSNGPTRDPSETWKPPPPGPDGARRTSRLWVTLNDQRAGATWAFFDVVIE